MSTMSVSLELASDAELITAARAGDLDAFGVLYGRHLAAARGLARQLARSAAEADDLVAEAFAKVLDSLRAGGGPDSAFRAYLLTTLRNTLYDKIRRDRRVEYSGDLSEMDQGVPFVDTALAGLESTLVARAFNTLPERWRTVLWHTEVEGESPAQVAPLLGLTPNGVSALAYRAREGLRQAYLQVHLQDETNGRCRATVQRLGAWARLGLSKRERLQVDTHLAGCTRCRALADEIADVNRGMVRVIGPLVLGLPAVAGYLAPAGAGAWAAAAGGAAAAGTAAAAATSGLGATAGTAGAGLATAGGAAGAGAAVGGSAGLGGAAGGAAAGGGTAVGGGAAAGAGTGLGAAAGGSAGAAAGTAAGGAGAGMAAGTGGAGMAAGAGAAGAAKAGVIATLMQMPAAAKLGAGIGAAMIAGGVVVAVTASPPQAAQPAAPSITATLTPAAPPGRRTGTGGSTTGRPATGGSAGPSGTGAPGGSVVPAGPVGSGSAPGASRSPAAPGGAVAGQPSTGSTSTDPAATDATPELAPAGAPLSADPASQSPNPFQQNRNGELDITVYNSTDTAASNVTLTLSVPAGITLRGNKKGATTEIVGPGWSCTESSGTFTCTTGTIAANSAATFGIKIKVAKGAQSGDLTGSLSATGMSGDFPASSLVVA